MLVKTLIKLLKQMPQDATVLVSPPCCYSPGAVSDINVIDEDVVSDDNTAIQEYEHPTRGHVRVLIPVVYKAGHAVLIE